MALCTCCQRVSRKYLGGGCGVSIKGRILLANLFPRDTAALAALDSPGSCTSTTAYARHNFRPWGVRQQYRDDFCMPLQSRCIRKLVGLPDHLVGQHEKGRGNREAKRLGGLE